MSDTPKPVKVVDLSDEPVEFTDEEGQQLYKLLTKYHVIYFVREGNDTDDFSIEDVLDDLESTVPNLVGYED